MAPDPSERGRGSFRPAEIMKEFAEPWPRNPLPSNSQRRCSAVSFPSEGCPWLGC
jgi:hypothetical protein